MVTPWNLTGILQLFNLFVKPEWRGEDAEFGMFCYGVLCLLLLTTPFGELNAAGQAFLKAETSLGKGLGASG